jgi:heat shock protein HslJ
MRTRSRIHLIAGALLTLVAVSAPVTAQSPAPAASPLNGSSWGVTAIGETPGSGATLVFTDGSAGGSAGCNLFSTSYTADETSLAFGPIATTMMACDEPVMAFEQSYLEALGEVASYAVEGATLTLSDGSGAVVLTFAAQSPATLEGVWRVTGYNNGRDAVVSPVEGTGVVVTFSADGTVSGTAGCNQFSGGYSIDGDSIAIGPLMSTMMACEDAIMAQEQAVIAALDGATHWQVTATGADLRGPGDALHLMLESLAPTAF